MIGAGIITAIFMMIKVNQYEPYDMTLNVESFVFEKTTAKKEDSITDEEFELLARCVEAEAGDQDFLGKCYVVDCILNRCDQWHQTIKETIYQKGQFEVTDNNTINTVKVTEETKRAIRHELKSRTNNEILYFRMDYFHKWIKDKSRNLFSHGDHYFSK